jgi:excinuclease ABC subunit B
VSYYDYYQPEAFIPVTNTYIEKDLAINQEIERMRLSATSALLSGRRDVIVVASISCIYGIGNPIEFNKSVIDLKKGQKMSRQGFLHRLVESLYVLTQRGTLHLRLQVIQFHFLPATTIRISLTNICSMIVFFIMTQYTTFN